MAAFAKQDGSWNNAIDLELLAAPQSALSSLDIMSNETRDTYLKVMSNEASEWEVHKTSSTITAAQAMSKLSMVGAEASMSTREYERRIANASTTSSIVSAEASMSTREYERRIANASTSSSIVSAETTMLTREYERRKADAHTVVSIVNVETTMSAREYERRILNASSICSIVSAETSMSTREYERRQANVSTTSIVSAETSILTREYERRQANVSTTSIVSAETSMSTREYERTKADAHTTTSIRNTERSKSTTEYERKKMEAHTLSSIETTEEDVVDSDEDFILTEAQPKARQFRADVPLPPPTDPITFTVEEKLNVLLDRYSFTKLVVEGTLSLQILNQDDGFIEVQVKDDENPDMFFKTHPNISREIFFIESILCLEKPNMPFPSGQAGVVILNWRLESDNESILPLSINCRSDRDFSKNGIYVCVEYGSLTTFDLQNVIISIPLPALRDTPPVWLTTGEWRYDSSLEWFIPLIDDSNGSGLLGFVVPSADLSVFFPISVQFTTTSNTISRLKVTNVLPLRDGPPPKFAQRTQLITESYQVVE